ncbi:MAG: hypothetical protein K0R44_3534 [Thermomicrobiales bacterium]|nr:hypothetical protein [Thermomicrobiales bacterium]
MAPGAQLQARRGSPEYPQEHGFISEIKTKASQATYRIILLTQSGVGEEERNYVSAGSSNAL